MAAIQAQDGANKNQQQQKPIKRRQCIGDCAIDKKSKEISVIVCFLLCKREILINI
jgi:hypothetical protein